MASTERQRAASKRFYSTNRERLRAQSAEKRARMTPEQRAERARKTRLYQDRNRRIIDEAKSVPCMRCAQTFPTIAMDLHHRDPRTKAGSVGRQAVGACWSAVRLTAEIAKCDVLCACCHRIVEDELRNTP